MTYETVKQEVEKMIFILLSQQQEKAKQSPTFSNYLMRGNLYLKLKQTALAPHLNAGIFNTVVRDMRKAGVISLGNQTVYLRTSLSEEVNAEVL